MAESKAKTRTQEHQVEIAASTDLVWKAISEADELVRWLCEKARVIPGEGGKFWVSWGETDDVEVGGSVIEAWEPGKRLRIRMLPYGGNYDAKAAAETPMFNEYTLDSVGGKTVVRLVHSGIPDSPNWEGFYDGTNRGWQLFMLALRHYIEKHAGTPRDNIMMMRPVSGSLIDAWNKLTGNPGLGLPADLSGPDSLTAAGAAAELPRYSAVTSQGEAISGEVMMLLPPKTLLINIEELGDALLTATFEEMGGQTFLYMTLATFGLGEERFAEVRSQWSDWMNGLLPQ